MTYNIRNSGARDGDNCWENRRSLWVRIVCGFNPDLLGVQEVLADQYEHLKEQFPDYTLAGVAREDGHRQGEWSLILFRTGRFDLLDSGNFWLSETPTVPGSKSWGTACCRLCSWVRLRDKQTGGKFVFANAHLDHVSELARVESAMLMVRRFDQIARGAAVVLTGDFNCTEVDEPYQVLIQSGLIDSYRSVHPERLQNETSFHDFRKPEPGLRIDWILHSHDLKATDAHIDRSRGDDNRSASDHDPVTTTLKWVV